MEQREIEENASRGREGEKKEKLRGQAESTTKWSEAQSRKVGEGGEEKKDHCTSERVRKEKEKAGKGREWYRARRVAGVDLVVGLDRCCYHGYGGSTTLLHY